jgi:hypothetical protein
MRAPERRSFKQSMQLMTTPLVRSDTFIRATRETGYRSTAFAIAELVDNAIQASAENVSIIVGRSGQDAGISVTVVDDGVGMTSEQMAQALQFGGSSRFDNRSGQGRFGMGLPNASLSQARRVDVYTWRDKASAIHTCLDSDAIAAGEQTGLPPVRARPLPPQVLEAAHSRGTAIVWSKCDRIPYQRPGMLTRHLHRELGRIFREYIDRQISLTLNGERVRPVDPIRVRPKPLAEGTVSVLPTLIFPFASGPSVAEVRVTFSVLPVDKWAGLSNDQKRAWGITGTGTVSILRAGREIALGWYLMGAKRRENYDDWWRCEIAFEPSLDEWFGVSHSKQGIRPTPELVAAISPSLEAQARSLNRLVREQFEKQKERSSNAAVVAELSHHKMVLGAESAAASLHSSTREQRIVSPAYAIDIRPSADAAFLSARRRLSNLVLTLNSNHPFYRKLYAVVVQEGSKPLRQTMDLFLLSLARVLASADSDDRESWNRLIESWSDATAMLLEER